MGLTEMPQDNSYIYKVGDRMPPDWNAPADSKTEWNWKCGQHLLLLTYYNLKPDEILSVREGEAEFAFSVQEGVIFMSYRFGTIPWSDNSYSWHLLSSEQQQAGGLPPIGAAQPATVMVMLIEGRTRVIRALRRAVLSSEMTEALHLAIRQQAEIAWEGREEHARRCQEVYRRFPTQDALVRAATSRAAVSGREIEVLPEITILTSAQALKQYLAGGGAGMHSITVVVS